MFGIGLRRSLGVARATLDAAIDLARGKHRSAQKAMRENKAVQGAIGRAEAALRAAAPISTRRPPKSGVT